MKINLQTIALAITLLGFSRETFSQAPTLGTAANFVLFTTTGAVSNTGLSLLTGEVGSNNGSSTGFGNVNGTMNNNNGATAAAATDLLTAYNTLNGTVAAFFPAPLLGNGQTLNAGVYSISGNSTLNNTLTLNAQGNANAVFILKIQGAFSANAGSKVLLTNGAKACNVFWKIEGLVSLAAGTEMKGNVIANNAAIVMSSGVILEGRALSTTGAITINNIKAYTPTGCGSPYLTGPAAPNLGSSVCYALFSGNGPVTNSGNTFLVGDVGTNVGLTTGHNALNVTGAIHPIADGNTAAAAAALGTAYTTLNTLAADILLLYPAQFGNKLTLTPHVYKMNGAATFNDTLFLNAEGNSNAVFVIQVQGAFSSNVYAKVKLTNGTQAKNVFWKIDGALNLANYTQFEGTIIVNNGAIVLGTGVAINGRALTTNGSLSTTAMSVTMTPGCGVAAIAPTITSQPANETTCMGGIGSFSVSATGSNLTYQWRKGTTNLTNGTNISGALSPVLVISNVSAGDIATNYNVIVSGAAAPSATSSSASLVADAAPVITTGPVSQTVCADQSATFSVSATGSTLTYQWRKGLVDLANGGHYSGVTTATLVVNPVAAADTAVNYNVLVNGICFPSKVSANAKLALCVTTPTIDTGLNSHGEYVNSVSFYPNPFTSVLNAVLMDGATKNSTLEIYNILGEKVISVAISNKVTTIDTSVLENGVYFYTVNSGNRTTQSGKLIAR